MVRNNTTSITQNQTSLFPELFMELERVHMYGWLCEIESTLNYPMD